MLFISLVNHSFILLHVRLQMWDGAEAGPPVPAATVRLNALW